MPPDRNSNADNAPRSTQSWPNSSKFDSGRCCATRNHVKPLKSTSSPITSNMAGNGRFTPTKIWTNAIVSSWPMMARLRSQKRCPRLTRPVIVIRCIAPVYPLREGGSSAVVRAASLCHCRLPAGRRRIAAMCPRDFFGKTFGTQAGAARFELVGGQRRHRAAPAVGGLRPRAAVERTAAARATRALGIGRFGHGSGDSRIHVGGMKPVGVGK